MVFESLNGYSTRPPLFGLKGRDNTAQGRAQRRPGFQSRGNQALKGRHSQPKDNASAPAYAALSGLDCG